MKFSNFLVFTLLFSLFTTSSCDNEEPVPVIEGSWALTSYESDISTTKDSSGVITLITSTGTASDISMEIGFEKGPNKFTSSGSYDLNVTIDEGGITYPRTYEDVTFGFNGGTWAKIATSVTMSMSGDITGMEIIELTETTLVLRYNALGQYWENDLSFDSEETAIYTFSRL